MNHQSYLNRALKARDPRYRRIFGKLGYDTAHMTADAEPASATVSIADLRTEYQNAFGKKPFAGWDAITLRDKIASKRNDG